MESASQYQEVSEKPMIQPQKIIPPSKSSMNPSVLQNQLEQFNQIYEKQQQLQSEIKKKEISVAVKGEKEAKGIYLKSSPRDIAKKISKKLANEICAAKVVYSQQESKELENDELYDIDRPLEGDCSLEFVKFDHPKAIEIMYHCSAQVLGCVLEEQYGDVFDLQFDEHGFSCDIYPRKQSISEEDFSSIERAFIKFASQLKRAYVSKAEAEVLFKDDSLKSQYIKDKIPEDGRVAIFCLGNIVDLCSGSYLPHISRIKVMKCIKVSEIASPSQEKKNLPPQRIHAMSSHQHIIEKEIAKRDHRVIGQQQELFCFIEMSPGSVFFRPHGARIFNKLVALIRKEYAYRGYSEVVSPNLFDKKLWDISGHWLNYKDNIFQLNIDERIAGIKPMNCPGHCLLFCADLRSYKELPLRFAEFGVLHRNEVSGALSGLLRLRRFVQDDAHIFCRPDQIQDELAGVLDLLKYVYGLFGLNYKLYLSSRPEGALGEKEVWEKAEEHLAKALDKFGHSWKVSPGDGAFYGPKIDIIVSDAQGREFQCGSVQLDFVLPSRFNLQYRACDHEEEHKELEEGEEQKQLEEGVSKEEIPVAHEHSVVESEKKESAEVKESSEGHLKHGFQRPVMIHRAIYGSLERFIAIIAENNGGKWPFWLSPRQIIVIPVSDEKHLAFAEAVYQRLRLEGFDAEIDRSNASLSKKIRDAQVAQFNFIAVVGDEEMLSGSVDLRERDQKERMGKVSVPKLIEHLKSLSAPDSEFKKKCVSKAYFHPSEAAGH